MIILQPYEEKLLAVVSIPLPDYPIKVDASGWDDALGKYYEGGQKQQLKSDEVYSLGDGTKIVIYRRSDESILSTNVYPEAGGSYYYIQNPSTS